MPAVGAIQRGVLAVALVSGVPAAAVAAEPSATPRTHVAAEIRHESVDSGLQDWQGLRLSVSRTGRWTRGWYGSLVHEERFGLSDTGIEVGRFHPLSDDWMLQVEAGGAADADFLPHGYAGLGVTRRLPGGWLLSGALRRSNYPTNRVDRASFDVERYIGTWRLAYGHDVARLDGANLGSHEIAADRYYGEGDAIGFRLAAGEEASRRPDGRLLATDVRAAWLRGTHRVSRGWALDWAAGVVDQQAAYDRSWIQVGIRKEL